MDIHISLRGVVVTLVILALLAGVIWLFTTGPIGQRNRYLDHLEAAVKYGDYQYFATKIETYGNRSFVPLYDVDSTHTSYSKGIGRLVQGFGKAHPELQVVSWSVDRYDGRQRSIIHGIWIDHHVSK